MNRTLLITNDFPPRPGGIQSFVHNLAVVSRPARWSSTRRAGAGAAKFDADQPFEVIRERTRVLLPTPSIARRAAAAGARVRLRHGVVRRGGAAWGCSPPGCGGGPASAGRWR